MSERRRFQKPRREYPQVNRAFDFIFYTLHRFDPDNRGFPEEMLIDVCINTGGISSPREVRDVLTIMVEKKYLVVFTETETGRKFYAPLH